MPRVNRAIDRGGEDDAPSLLKADEGVGPGRRVGRDIRAGNGDKAAAVSQSRQSRSDMAIGGVGHAPRDMRHGGEWRVHQHDRGNKRGIEMIVDLRRVEAGHRERRKKTRQKIGARLRQLVEMQGRAGHLGEDGKQSRAGGGF